MNFKKDTSFEIKAAPAVAKPEFSVIMPTFNRAFCIQNAVNSLLNQTYQAFELIIVDDGSTDGTEELVKSVYCKEIEAGKIVYKKMKKNGGVCRARNSGLKTAKNPWICYLDTDNKMCPTFLEDFSKAILNNPYNKTFYASFKKTSGEVVGLKFNYEELFRGNYIDLGIFCHHKSLIKKFGNFDVKLRRLVDWDLILRYTRKNPPYFINKVLMEYSNDACKERISTLEDFNTAREYVLEKNEKISLGLKKRIFSFKNLPSCGRWHRVIWFLGFKISIRNKQKEILEGVRDRISSLEEKFDKEISEAFKDIKALQNKLNSTEFGVSNAENQDLQQPPPISKNKTRAEIAEAGYNTFVTILSVLENSGSFEAASAKTEKTKTSCTASFLDFYILVPDNFPDYLKSYFYNLQTRYPNFNINFINMSVNYNLL